MRPLLHKLGTAAVWLVAASFVLGAVTKFWPGATFAGPAYAERFVEWGYPAWFRFVVGAGEALGAGMLVAPRWRFLGSVGLLAILEGAIVTHVINHEPIGQSIAAPIMFTVVAIIAWRSRPAGLTLLRDRGRQGVTRTATHEEAR